MESLCSRLVLFVFLVVAALHALPANSNAQTSCPSLADDANEKQLRGAIGMALSKPICTVLMIEGFAYDEFGQNKIPPAIRFMLATPDDEPRSAATSPVKVLFSPSGGRSRAQFKKIECDGATIAKTSHGVLEIKLPDGESCDLLVSAPVGANGTVVSFEGELTRDDESYLLTNAKLTGGVFGE